MTWKSRRHSTVAASTAESELVEAVDAHLRERNVALLMAEMNRVRVVV